MVELKLNIKKQDIRVFNDKYDQSASKALAESSKKKAFGVLSVFDKADNIELTHTEKRYEPFWHIVGESYIDYLRKNNYGFDVEPQVRSVKIAEIVFEITGDKPYCGFEAEDHCVEHYTREVLTDATEGKLKEKELRKYIDFEEDTRTIKQTEELMGDNKVVVPAKIKAAYLVRDFVKEMIKPVHADKILNESVQITKIVLYFRPIYAFEFTNKKSKKTGVLDIDALTGDISKGVVYKTSLKELIPEGALFDVGTELASWVIPGAGIGAVVGKAIKQRSDKKKAVKAMQSSKAAMEAKSKRKK